MTDDPTLVREAEPPLEPLADGAEDGLDGHVAAPSDAGGPTGAAEPHTEPPAEAPHPPVEPAPPRLEPPASAIAQPEPDGAPTAIDDEATPTGGPRTPTPMAAPTTIAGLVALALRAAGVRSAFTVPGESFLPLLDALVDAGIKVVATRHENGAAFMAAAQAQLTGRPSLCLATRAVGAANLAIGLHAARADSAPVIAIVGGVARSLAGREAFQDADLAGSVGRLTIWSATLDDPSTAPAVLEQALATAVAGRPGPVLLAIPEDVLLEPLAADTRWEVPRSPALRPSDPDVRAVLQFLAAAERPVILAGGGVLRARTSTDLVRLAELLHVPVMAAWRRGDVVPNDHPLYLGVTGLGSPTVVRERLAAADAIVVIGCRLNEMTTFDYAIPADGQPWIHVDVEPRTGDVPGLPRPALAVRADARAFVRAALVRLRSGVLDARLVDLRRAANATDREAWLSATVVDEAAWDGPGVHPGKVVAVLGRVLPDDAILTTDAGNFAGWAARGFRFRRPGTFLGPTSGAMGYGLPAAIGAAVVHRDRPVVAMTGDGGLAMSMAELETAVREGLRVIVLVFDNERYGTIRMHQDRDARQPVATDLGPIDFAAIARACGARGVRVDSDVAFEPALRQALATADRPTVIQLALDRRWVSVDDHP
jgi:acetolactate synthase-1/2/3 large subunit